MNKTFKYKLYRMIIIVLLFAIMFLFAGCGNNNDNSSCENNGKNDARQEDILPENPDNKNDNTEYLGHLEYEDENGKTVLSVDYNYPDLSEILDGEALENAEIYYDDMLNEKKAYWEQELYKDAIESQKGTAFVPYTVSEDYIIMANTDTYVSIQRVVTEFIGGTHEDIRIYGDTFLKSNGATLLMSDMFSVPQEQYKELMLKNIYEQMDNKDIIYFDDAKESAEYLFDEIQYYLTDTSICICYQTYDLAPYTEGYQIFEIRFSDLKDILGEEYITYDFTKE